MDLKTRRIAKKYSVASLKKGQFVISDNTEEPNHVVVKNDKVFRVNLIGTVIDKIDIAGKTNLVLDDGANISLRSFQDMDFGRFAIGDVVIVTGRPRQSNNDIFVAVETISKINPEWMNVRKKELQFFEVQYADSEPVLSQQTITEDNLIEKEESFMSGKKLIDDPKQVYSSIVKILEELDKGEGANFIDVLGKLKEQGLDLEKSELMINKMILDGDIFEIQGNLKLSQ